MSRGLAAVTGATGFLGQHIVRALSDDGWRVRILARREPISPFWLGLQPEAVLGDLGDEGAVSRLCRGADLVVHAAGLLGGAKADLQRVNLGGSQRIAAAVAANPGTRLMQVSSLAAREPQLSAYAASKRAGEDAVRATLGDRATVVRPPAVYGPGDRETLRLFALAASSPLLPVLDPKARLALVHAEDAARQIASLAGVRTAAPIALTDSRPEGYGWEEIMQTAAKAFGREPLLLRIPVALLYGIAATERLHIPGRGDKAAFTFDKIREMRHPDWGVRPEERATTSPAPRFDLLSGFRHTVGWYRSQGWL